MIFTIFVELFLICICSHYILNNRLSYNLSKDVVFILFLFLQIARIYYQSYFLDIPDYEVMFNYIKPIYQLGCRSIISYFDSSEFSQTEYGYLFLISMFKCLSGSFQLFLFFISIFQCYITKKFCDHYKINIFLALPIYFSLTFITFQIGMLRQAIAFLFLMLALININNKFKFIFSLFIGFFFHKSILFCLLLVGANKKIPYKITLIVFLASLLVYLLQIDYIGQVWDIMARDDLGRVEFYLSVDRENSFLGFGFWERVLLFLYMLYFRYKYKDQDDVLTLFFNIGCFAIVFQLFFYSSPTIASRLRYYVIIAPTLYILMCVKIYLQKNKFLYLFPIFIYLMFYSAYQASYLL